MFLLGVFLLFGASFACETGFLALTCFFFICITCIPSKSELADFLSSLLLLYDGRQAEAPEGAAQSQLFKIVKIGFLQS